MKAWLKWLITFGFFATIVLAIATENFIWNIMFYVLTCILIFLLIKDINDFFIRKIKSKSKRK